MTPRMATPRMARPAHGFILVRSSSVGRLCYPWEKPHREELNGESRRHFHHATLAVDDPHYCQPMTAFRSVTITAITARRQSHAFLPVFQPFPAISYILSCARNLQQGILQSEVWHAENSSDAVYLVFSLSPNQCHFHAADRAINAGGES